jgi:hypothetical protein
MHFRADIALGALCLQSLIAKTLAFRFLDFPQAFEAGLDDERIAGSKCTGAPRSGVMMSLPGADNLA